MNLLIKTRKRNQKGGAQIAEFAASLPIIFVVIFFLVEVITYMSALATAGLIANVTSRAAAPAVSLTTAQSNAVAKANEILNGPFGSWVNITPKDGSTAVKLKVLQVPVGGGAPMDFSGTVDTTKYFYEYQSNCTFKIAPFICNDAFGDIPILGAPKDMKYSSTAYVEHPEGLSN